MDENEFLRLLSLFPVVRTREYNGDVVASSSQSTSYAGKDEVSKWQESWNEDSQNALETKDAFWGKLRLAAEKKIGEVEAEKFCISFRKVYQKLVHEGISEEAAQRYLNSC